jgi:hypothetical protein
MQVQNETVYHHPHPPAVIAGQLIGSQAFAHSFKDGRFGDLVCHGYSWNIKKAEFSVYINLTCA